MSDSLSHQEQRPARPEGPSVSTIALGLVSLAVAVLVIVYQVGDFTLDWSLAGPGAVIGVGAVLVLIGLATMLRRRGDDVDEEEGTSTGY